VARARQLAAALAAHGVQPPPRRLASAAALLAGGEHDATRARTLHAPADLLPDLDRPLSCGDLRARFFLLLIPTLIPLSGVDTTSHL
jgi:hypothetical protein